MAASREQLASMVAVLNKRWLSMGWRVMDRSDAEPMALVFIERLEGIPYQHYGELATRAGELRARRIEQGLKCDDFSADMMLAAWPSLRQELHEREIARGRTLTATSQTNCQRCYGTGVEKIFDAEGKSKGFRPGCKHEYVDAEPETTDGLDAILATAHGAAIETAPEICRRLRVDLMKEWVALPDGAEAHQVWQAMSYLSSVERHCTEVANTA